MKIQRSTLAATAALSLGLANCGQSVPNDQEQTGSLEIALTQAPTDVACLRITVASAARTNVKLFPLSAGQSTVFKANGLAVGIATVKGDAFAQACASLSAASVATWTSDPISTSIQVFDVAHVALNMVRNGRLSVGVNFDDANGGSLPGGGTSAACTTSSAPSYLLPVGAGVQVKPLLTVGDSPNLKPDGVTPYRMVGIPDGLGAFDNGDGTFTFLANQELVGTVGAVREHGAKGAFVSKWNVRKSDFAVCKGEDLIKQVAVWNPGASAYSPLATAITMSRLCSADLPARSAFFDPASGLGTEARIFMNGEESGIEGRAFAHLMDGNSYELPRLGKFSWENSVASPAPSVKTVVVGLDDGTGGQVYVYVGNKTNTGTDIEKAGLTNGALYSIKVTGAPLEDPLTGIAPGAFTLAPHGNVENSTGAALEAGSVALGATTFARPEDGAWDPNSPNDFYFVTTANFAGNSRLWRLRFVDATNPTLGGRIEMMLDGSEGQKMMDNLAIDKRGHILIQEDPGNQEHLAKVYRYTIATDTLTLIAEHDPARFVTGAPMFLTRDEENSGIIDMADILGDGWFLAADQIHYNIGDAELVEGGQFQLIYDEGSTR